MSCFKSSIKNKLSFLKIKLGDDVKEISCFISGRSRRPHLPIKLRSYRRHSQCIGFRVNICLMERQAILVKLFALVSSWLQILEQIIWEKLPFLFQDLDSRFLIWINFRLHLKLFRWWSKANSRNELGSSRSLLPN